MNLQLEAILKQRLQHQSYFIEICRGAFRFALDIEAVRVYPTGAAGYLELLKPIREPHQLFQRYVFATAAPAAITSTPGCATSRMVRLD
jgi:hypothetical protein